MTSTRKVLIVEDEPDMVATYERLLRRHGYRTIAGCPMATGSLSSGPRGCLRRRPPVIVVSGFTSGASREAAALAGATAVLSKPFSTEAFTKLVRAILEGGRH